MNNILEIYHNNTAQKLKCSKHLYTENIDVEDKNIYYFNDFFVIIDKCHNNLFDSIINPLFLSDAINNEYSFTLDGATCEQIKPHIIVEQNNAETYTINVDGLNKFLAKFIDAKYSIMQTGSELFHILKEFTVSKYHLEIYYYYMNSKTNIKSYLKLRNLFASEIAWIATDSENNLYKTYKPYYFNEYDANSLRFVSDLYMSNLLPTADNLILPCLPYKTTMSLYRRIKSGYAHVKNCTINEPVSLIKDSTQQYEPCCNKPKEACTCWSMIQQPKFTPFSVLKIPTSKKLVGFELEVDFLEDIGCDHIDEDIDSAIVLKTATTRIDSKLLSATDKELYLKYEGSVDSGIELVSTPLKPEHFLLERWKNVFTILNECKVYTGKDSYFSTGLHFHFSKTWFVDKEHAKRVNNEITKMYTNGDLCEIANRSVKTLISNAKPTSSIILDEIDRDVAMSERENTYEFRFFASTQSYERFCQCLAFIIFLINETVDGELEYYSKEYIEYRYKLKRSK